MTVNGKYLKEGDKVMVVGFISKIDPADKQFPLLIDFGDGALVWIGADPVVAHLTTADEKGPANDD